MSAHQMNADEALAAYLATGKGFTASSAQGNAYCGFKAGFDFAKQLNASRVYDCKTHGTWDAFRVSGCPLCVSDARERIAKLEKALQFYANKEHVTEGIGWDSQPSVEDGEVARDILAKVAK